MRQQHLLPPALVHPCSVYCVLTVVMKVSMVRNKTRKLLVTKTKSVLPSVLHSQLSRHKNCNKTIVTNQLYCAVSALHEGNWLSHNSQWLWKDCHYVHLYYSFYQSLVYLCLPDSTDKMQKCCSDLFPPVYGRMAGVSFISCFVWGVWTSRGQCQHSRHIIICANLVLLHHYIAYITFKSKDLQRLFNFEQQ